MEYECKQREYSKVEYSKRNTVSAKKPNLSKFEFLLKALDNHKFEMPMVCH